MSELETELANVLCKITWLESLPTINYDLRYELVLDALKLAHHLTTAKDKDSFEKYPSGFRHDPDDPDWPVIVISLPNVGQVSWHMPPSKIPYDGHDNQEKQKRIALYASAVFPPKNFPPTENP